MKKTILAILILSSTLTGCVLLLVGGSAFVAGYAIGKYEELQNKTAQQVYKENPTYAKKDSQLQPAIVNFKTPYITDTNNNVINILPSGPIKLCMDYDVVIGSGNTVQEVEVIENNYLVMPDGTKTKDAIRKKIRTVGGNTARQTVTLPKNLPAGNYTHVASVTMGANTITREQTNIVVARVNKTIITYASNVNK